MSTKEESPHERIVRLLQENRGPDDQTRSHYSVTGNGNVTLQGNTIMVMACPALDLCSSRGQRQMIGMMQSIVELLRTQLEAANSPEHLDS